QKKCNFNTIITSKALLQKINCPVLSGMVFLEDIMENLTLLDKLFAAIKASLPLALLTKFIHSGSEDNNVVVLFTTGSEKEPKAVQLSHKNIHANLESLIPVYELNEKETFLANLPYFHVFGQTGCLWAPLYVGATIVTYANPLDFATICQIIREERCTFVGGTPSFFAGYLQKSQPDDFQSVRIFLVGADRCPDYLRKQFLAQHQKVLFEAYGATETSPGIAVNGPNSNRPGSVGKPISGVTVRIENLQTGEECRNGETGRILVKGDNVMRGYLNDPEQTSRAFHNGWYDTGDMGWLDPDGYLWIAGRLKRFVKVGGEMISLVNVEDVLLKFLPDGIT
ncbi:MAG: AMP-binding protein, partial [Bacteroidota bacterium]